MSEYATFRACALALAVIILTAVAPTATCAAQDGSNSSNADATTQKKPQYHPKRRDNVFGTMDENMFMGKDRRTGDNIIRIEPPPQPKQQQ